MNLKGLGDESVNHDLFGGIARAVKHQRYHINLSNVDGSYNYQLEVLDEKKMCASIRSMIAEHCLNQLKYLDLWKLDTLGIDDSSEKCSKTENQQLALKHFRETVSRDNTGRY
ncbi:uncharacterized protein NPIL_666611 [Nephila pilipes]|uniref:Uncharacterized protein n=1 Tax=Nephila pilipes TaxID=299642 RepID=A0A8X6TJR5_NEPPI|nr:uncharacterized protein NPIL_666611 [Nephila pilipes]